MHTVARSAREGKEEGVTPLRERNPATSPLCTKANKGGRGVHFPRVSCRLASHELWQCSKASPVAAHSARYSVTRSAVSPAAFTSSLLAQLHSSYLRLEDVFQAVHGPNHG